MKKEIKTITSLLLLCCLWSFVYAQNTGAAANTTRQKDSAALKALVVALLAWQRTDKKSDFEPLLQHPNDTVYAGIDWQVHQQSVAALEKTNFFTKDFLDNYQQIALLLDEEMKHNKTKYAVGDLPPYGNEANPWCNCQDYPPNSFKRLQIVALTINANTASFKWTWGHKFFYGVKAKKANNSWKIAALEGFTKNNFLW